MAIAPGAAYRFRLRATDTAGNTSSWVTTSAAKLALVQENATSITYAGTWKRVSMTAASGGYVKYATRSGATATLTFSGTSVALVTDTGPARGLAELWLDGHKVATLDLYSATVAKKQLVWAPTAPLAAGSHTLQLTVLGAKNAHSTSTRVDLDAFAVWG